VMQQSVEALAAVPARMNEAWNRGDATGFAADLAAAVHLVEFNGDILRGRDAIVVAQQPMFDTVLKGSRMVNSEVVFAQIVQPGVGIVHHRVSLLMPGETTSAPARALMQLFVLHWQQERWQVVVVQNARVLSFEDAGRLDTLTSG
jgi:uncharacterized protein (TIGR02246 family)